MQKVWTLLALVLIAAIFYRVAYDVPHNTCNDIWLQAERRQNDPERADFVVQCVHSVETSGLFRRRLLEGKGPKTVGEQVAMRHNRLATLTLAAAIRDVAAALVARIRPSARWATASPTCGGPADVRQGCNRNRISRSLAENKGAGSGQATSH